MGRREREALFITISARLGDHDRVAERSFRLARCSANGGSVGAWAVAEDGVRDAGVPGPFDGSDSTGDLGVVGSEVVVLVAGLPRAYCSTMRAAFTLPAAALSTIARMICATSASLTASAAVRQSPAIRSFFSSTESIIAIVIPL